MNKYKLFDEPTKAYERIFKKISNAKKSIYVETYRIANDPIGRKLIDLLIKKSEEGLKVEVICDDLGWGKFSYLRRKKILESKIKLHIFNPWFEKITWSNFRKYWNIHFRDHRKLTIVDEKIAYVGGMNYTSRELKWKDMAVEIEGDILKDLVLCSKEMIKISDKKNFKRRKIYKKLSKKFDGEDIIVRQIPYSKHRLLKKELIKIFDSAREEIIIVTPYLVPDLPFRRALRKAVKRGIRITIMIPKKTDSLLSNMMNHFGSYVSTKSGINVILYPKMIHSKYLIVDSEIASFGSANLDYQTFNHNYELNILTRNQKLIHDLKRSFGKDSKLCEKYHEKNWSKRFWINKLVMRILVKYKNHF
jgi:cardiolipin synthase